MKKIYPILILLFSNLLHAQSSKSKLFESLNNIQTTTELTSISNLRFEQKYREYLNFGIEHSSWTMYKKNNKKLQDTRLLTLSLDGQIFYKELYKIKRRNNESIFKVLYSQKEKELLEKLNKTAFQSVKSEIDFELINRGYEKNTFGYVCYVSASMPTDGEKMIELVASKDEMQLTKWLKSIDPVKQVYAYLGLKLLQSKNKLKLPDEIEKLMEQLEVSETPIFTCFGCTTWEYSQIKNVLKQDEVTKFITRRSKLK